MEVPAEQVCGEFAAVPLLLLDGSAGGRIVRNHLGVTFMARSATMWLMAGVCWLGFPASGHALTIGVSGVSGPFSLQSISTRPASPDGLFGFDTLTISANGLVVAPYDLDISLSGIDPGGWAWLAIENLITNVTEETWTDYHFWIGHGSGDDWMRSCECDTTFVLTDPVPHESAGFFRLDPSNPYDEPDGPDELNYLGLLHPSGGQARFVMALRVADAFDGVPGDGKSRFTLRQLPTTSAPVPEPSTGALAALALAAGSCAVWWRGRQRPDSGRSR